MAGEKYNIQLEAIEIFNRLQQVPQLAEGLSNLLQNFNSHNHDLRNDTRYQPLGDYAADVHTHSATDITEDSTHKFMTQMEKNTLSSLGTNAALKDFSNVTTKSLGQNGYYKFPDGLLIQWGQRAGSSTSGISVYLPVSFYDTNYIVQGSIVKSNSDAITYSATPLLNPTKSSFIMDRNFSSTGGSGTSTGTFNWIAIGRWK